ncbi:MAG: enoyl-CoA hydratase [Ottowia sp.]|nr:enoyl-CoA hydratase [Ottowia sp.]
MTQASGQISAEFRAGIWEVRISNPARYNAISMRMWEQLARVLEQADQDDAVRVVVLTGEGKRAFASGADISEFDQFSSDPSLIERFNHAVHAATRALAACRHPTIALIRGICMGGGMSVAQACDVRYCAEDARFRMPAGQMGIGYEPEDIRHLVSVVGAARAADLFYTARTFFGREAERMGYVQECFSVEDFDACSQARVAAVSRMAPLTLRAFKLALRRMTGAADAPDPDVVNHAFLACFHSADYREGQLAFRERRQPVFMGR